MGERGGGRGRGRREGEGEEGFWGRGKREEKEIGGWRIRRDCGGGREEGLWRKGKEELCGTEEGRIGVVGKGGGHREGEGE